MPYEMLPLRAGWSATELPLDRIERDRVREDSLVFTSLVSSSFLEITSSLYTRNLVAYYTDEPEFQDWLLETWEPEELNHGRAMRAYVESVWPEYDWERAYTSFVSEYAPLCVPESFHGSRALEMLARCVTETEAAITYKAFADYCQEPVLRQILLRMYRDEVRHYGYFLQFFEKYDATERNGTFRLLRVLIQRSEEVEAADLGTVLKHVGQGWVSSPGFGSAQCERALSECAQHLAAGADLALAKRMLARPLGWRVDSKRARLLERALRIKLEFASRPRAA